MRRILIALTALLAATACAPTTVNKGTVGPAGGAVSVEPAASQAPTPTWGQRYTWPDGLAVEVSAPTPCKASKYAAGVEGKARVVKFTITMVNGTKEAAEASMLGLGTDYQFNGAKIDTVTDLDGPCGNGYGSGTVLPGKTFQFVVSFGLDKDPGELQMAFQPHLMQDKAVFVGKV